MSEYKAVTYGTGRCFKVTPTDRGADVLHHLVTGGLLGGRSLGGVTWEEVEAPPEYARSLRKSTRELA